MSSRNRLASQRKNKDSRFHFEKLEDRNLLSGTTGLVQANIPVGHEASLLTLLSENNETNHLLNGIHGLRMVDVKASADQTTTVFKHTIHGMPVHGAFVTVVQDADNVVQDVRDRSFQGQLTEGTQRPSVAAITAQAFANQSVSTTGAWNSSAELVWFVRGGEAELAWEVSTSVEGVNVNNSDLNFVSVVDASAVGLLSQVQSPSIVSDLLETKINPRIVINDTIGEQGSRDYAADPRWASVVQVNNSCTGALAAPNMVISARHCGVSAGADIDFGIDSNNPDNVFTVESAILPNGPGTLLDGGDVVILILTDDVPSSVAEPYRFSDQTDTLEGQLAFTLGYGFNGVGSTGHGGTSDGIRWGGENIIDVYGDAANAGGGTANIISTDFDDGSAGANTIAGSDATPLEFEATTAPGDSGGAIFIEQGSSLLIAGVLSGGTSPQSLFGDTSWWTGTAVFQEIIEENGGVFGGDSGEIDVMVDGRSQATGSTLDFGVRTLGDAETKTFTVTNSAETTLTLADDLRVIGNEFTLLSGFGDLELEQGESTTFTVRFDASALGTFDGAIIFGSSDGDESPYLIRLEGAVAGTIGEAGLVEVSNRWQTVALDTTFLDPVVVAGPVSSNEADPAVVRIRNVTADSFQIRVQEWRYLDGKHVAERISYAVLERGVHRLATGQTVVAGKVDGIETSFDSELFALPFDETPVVVASSNTYNGGAPITTRVKNITKTGFQVAVQEEEAADNIHNGETIGYFAFIQEEGTLGGLRSDIERTGRNVDEKAVSLPIQGGFTDPPVFLATMQTTVGTNTASLRMTDISNSQATVFVEEEQSRDTETGHGNEVVGYWAIEEGVLLGTTAVGESMTVTLDRDWQTIRTEANYLDPVIIASTNTMNESDPLTVRVRNVTANSFDIHIEEWNYLDLDHAPETVSVMVFESGIHRLRDGTVIEARNSEADLNWTNIDLTRDYGTQAPAVFSQIVTDNGPATATIRTRNVSENSFEIRVQEEEAAADGHVAETISWVAVQPGAGFTGGLQYDILKPATGANHKGETYTFDAAFNRVPVAITAMQTTRGTNAATVRQSSITTTEINLFIEEEQSFDNETGHGLEDVAIFAAAEGILDGVLLEFFEEDSGGVVGPASGFRSAFPTPASSNAIQQQSLAANQRTLVSMDRSEATERDEVALSTGLSPLAGATQLSTDSSTINVATSSRVAASEALAITDLDKAFESLM